MLYVSGLEMRQLPALSPVTRATLGGPHCYAHLVKKETGLEKFSKC